MTNSSKRKKSAKAAAAGALLLAVMLAASACGGGNADKADNASQDAVNGAPQQVEDLPDQSGMIEPGVAGSDNNGSNNGNSGTADNDGGSDSDGEAAAPETKSGMGTFTGIVDTTSIEITTEGEAAVFQFADDLKPAIEALPEDAEVKFEYTEKAVEGDSSAKQLVLLSIEIVK